MKPSWFALLPLWLAPLVASHAGVLMLSHDESEQRLRIVDDGTRSAISLPTIGRGVQAGSVTADATGDRVFLITNAATGQTLHALGYAGGGVEQAALPSALRVTHLEWDGSGTPRLVGLAIDTTTDAAVLVEFRGGMLTSLGMPTMDDIRFRTGASAFRASDDSLFLVGRLAAETQDRLFRFALAAVPTVASAPIDGDLQLLELAVAANGDVFGLARSALSGNTHLVTVDAALAITPRGPGTSGCCFVLAGATAIDTTGPALVALGSSQTDGASGNLRPWRFDLATGSILDTVTVVSAIALFHDATSVLPGEDVLFADGFETGLGLPRRR